MSNLRGDSSLVTTDLLPYAGSSWDGWDIQIKSDLNDYDIILERRLMLPWKLKYRKRKDYKEWWKQWKSGKISYFFLAASAHCDTFFLDRLLFCWVLLGFFSFSFKLHTHFLLRGISSKGFSMDLLLGKYSTMTARKHLLG